MQTINLKYNKDIKIFLTDKIQKQFQITTNDYVTDS